MYSFCVFFSSLFVTFFSFPHTLGSSLYTEELRWNDNLND